MQDFFSNSIQRDGKLGNCNRFFYKVKCMNFNNMKYLFN